MMNIVAISILLSSLGTVVVLSPEPLLVREETEYGESPPLKAVKDATRETLHTAADYARQTGEGIKHMAGSSFQASSDAVGAMNGKTEEMVAEDDLVVAREKAAAASDAFEEATRHFTDAARERLGFPTTESLMSQSGASCDETGEYVSQATEAVKHATGRVGEWLQEGASETYHSAGSADTTEDTLAGATTKVYDSVASAGDAVSHAAGSAKDSMFSKTKQGVEKAHDSATKILEPAKNKVFKIVGSTEDILLRKQGNAKDSALQAVDSTKIAAKDAVAKLSETVETAAGKIEETAKENGRGFVEKVKEVAHKTEAVLKLRAQEAGPHLPNVGQGAAFVHDYSASGRQKGVTSEDTAQKSNEYSDSTQSGSQGALKIAEEFKAAKFKLVKTAESLGWRRAAQPERVDRSSLSPYDLVLGNVKYVWQGQTQEGYIHWAVEAIKEAAQSVGARLGIAADSARAAAVQAFEGVKDTAGSANDTLRDFKDKIVPCISNLGEQSKEIVEERLRPAGKEYESGRGKSGAYVEQAGKDVTGKRPRSWRQVLFRRPVGLPLSLTRLLHLFTFSTSYGSAVWVTFVSGLILSKNTPRQQFAYIQSRMFPVYLRLMALGEVLLFLLYSVMHPWLSADRSERWQLQNLIWTIVATLVNTYFLEPRVTKVMFKRLKLEKEEGRGLETVEVPEAPESVDNETKKKLAAVQPEIHDAAYLLIGPEFEHFRRLDLASLALGSTPCCLTV